MAPSTSKTKSGAAPSRAARARSSVKKRDREVLDAAAKVFYERGYSDASVQDVADELGILKGSLYHYIETKEDLLFRLLEETHDEVHGILDEVDGVEGLSPLQRLELYVRRQVEYNVDNMLRVSVYYHDIERLTDERRKTIIGRRRDHERWVTRQIELAQEAGDADASLDPKLLSNCIFGTIIWTYRWYRRGRHQRERVAEVCAAYALRGVIGIR